MSLRKAYEAELKKAEAEQGEKVAPRREAVERLRTFYELIMAEGLPDTTLEVEFSNDELLIDPGQIMITVRVTPEGDYRLFYEQKRPDRYETTEVPGMTSVQDLEGAIARLMVQFR